MRKAILILLATLLVSAPVFAQNSAIDPDKITYGAQAGINIQKGIGAFIGGFAQLPFLMEDMYLQAGAELALRRSGNSYTSEMRNLYLEIPLHLGYHMFLSHEFSLYGDIGPYVGLALVRTNCAKYGLHHQNIFDVGVGLNIGAEFQEAFRVFVGYDFGFIPTFKGDHTYNRGFKVGVGYRF